MPLDPARVVAVRSHAAAQAVLTPNGSAEDFDLTAEAINACPIFQSVARLLEGLELDGARPDQDSWNPLGELIAPGERVVIKPNLVFHEHYRGGLLQGVVTDPRLIRAMADFVFRAIGPTGELVIGDAPLQSANWGLLCQRTGLGALPEFYAARGLRCKLRDFRTIESVNHAGLKLQSHKLAGDPEGYCAVDLGAESAHQGRPWEGMRVTNYDPAAMREHHNAHRHEYLVSGSVLGATTVINMAKLKTHRKSGLTGPLKNLVGINGCKDWLPHHTRGSVPAGGDEYPAAARWKELSTWLVEREERAPGEVAKRGWNALRKSVWFAGKRLSSDTRWEGSWHGNDTLWRTIIDLNRAAKFADANGALRSTPQRKFFVVVDAILAGEGEGPMAPSPVPMGVLLGGITPAAVETAAIQLAGWPVKSLPLAVNAFKPHPYPLADFDMDQIRIDAWEVHGRGMAAASFHSFAHSFKPCQGWLGLFHETATRLAHAV